MYEVLRGFRCAPWFHAYLVARHRMGERLGGGRGLEAALDGFHPLPDYFTTRAFYRWAVGQRGRATVPSVADNALSVLLRSIGYWPTASLLL